MVSLWLNDNAFDCVLMAVFETFIDTPMSCLCTHGSPSDPNQMTFGHRHSDTNTLRSLLNINKPLGIPEIIENIQYDNPGNSYIYYVRIRRYTANQFKMDCQVIGLSTSYALNLKNVIVSNTVATDFQTTFSIGKNLEDGNECGLKIGYVSYKKYVSDQHTQQELDLLYNEWK